MILDRMKVLSLWQNASIKTARAREMMGIADQIVKYKADFYDPVEQATGVPWYFVGAIDCREESFRHNAYLGNGDPLAKKTIHVPRGRGPFKTWYDGAIDAFHVDGVGHLPVGGHWDVVTALIKAESYNGMGYAAMGLPSPYVWGGTNVQRPGKYVADGHFSTTTWDAQPGVAAMFLALKEFHGVDLKEQ